MASFSYDCSTRDNMLILKSREVGKSERLVLGPGDHSSLGSVALMPLRSREELFEQFF